MATASRTVNPLHFEDLEPRRFEDLVRQLLYDFRDWRALEATGRSGSDDGFDARGWEVINHQLLEHEDEEDLDQNAVPSYKDRIWLIQCKRERVITPKKLVGYLEDISKDELSNLHGLVFVAACDFSKKSHDEFRKWCVTAGLEEFQLWGKAALEDFLFQPRQDHLLFGYFGISLQIRKRSLKSSLRARLATKRQVIRLIGGVQGRSRNPILLRDAEATQYPYSGEIADVHKRPLWAVYYFLGHYESGIKILIRSHLAYVKDGANEWDAMEKLRTNQHCDDPWAKEVDRDLDAKVRAIWEKVPKENQAFLEVVGLVPYDQILAIDEAGDECCNHPHVYLQCSEESGLFGGGAYAVVRTAHSYSEYEYEAELTNQILYFPQKYRSRG
uniref:hypothetical protein n=1 Tax=Marinobacterium profundum TaxID=1714300 RepID=UPI00082E0722|nr:hypothetical protein [Marinobacterium profundum]